MGCCPGSRTESSGRGCRHPQVRLVVFGHRLRQAGLLGNMGRVASSADNATIGSFWSTLQRELLDTRRWADQKELDLAIFGWIEARYNPRRRHTSLGMLSPGEFEALHSKTAAAA